MLLISIGKIDEKSWRKKITGEEKKKLGGCTYLGIGFQVVVENVDGDGKISGVERVAPVPTLWPKLLSLAHHGMEVAEGKEDDLELRLTGAHLQCVLVEVVERLVQVGKHTRRRLVGDLDGRLQDTYKKEEKKGEG